MRARCAAAVIAGILGCLAAPASADPRSEIAAKTRAAMASYDSMDYEAARRLLNQALAIAKKAHLDKDPIVARVYLDLGITQLAGSDQEAARVALLSAVQIDPRIAIDAAYRSPELVKLLDEARAAAGGDAEPADADCRAGRGVRPVIDPVRPGAAQPVEVLIGGDLAPARVAVMYRPEGAIDFTDLRLARQSSCRYTGTIPASATRGSLLHYYVAAYDGANKVLASKGSSGTPNTLELRAAGASGDPGDSGAAAPVDTEDPIGAPRGRPSAEVTDTVAPAHKPHKAAIAISGGTGVGYVTGRTEGDNQVQTCCIGSSPVVLQAELGYYTSARLSLGLAARIGFPIGANIAGHSTIAPAGFLRARYALSASGDGLRIMGEIGAGILRNTIKLDATMPNMDTDVVAQGPLLLGAGIGYIRHISSSVAFLVDLDAMAGIAVAKKLGSAVHLNTGISADMRFGVAVGF